MRLGNVVLDTPFLVGDTVFTHAILVKSPFCVACVDHSSLKNTEVRSYKGNKKPGSVDPTPTIPIQGSNVLFVQTKQDAEGKHYALGSAHMHCG